LIDDIAANSRNLGLLKGYDAQTRAKREALFQADAATVAEAKNRLGQTDGNRGRAWHVFEGTTMVDCALFFEGVTVFVEGKRTESRLTTGTRWHDRRHQVIRNLDCLRAEATTERWYVMTVVEEGNSSLVGDAKALDRDQQAFGDALPHLTATEVDEAREHYLGWTTWQMIRSTFRLPKYPDKVLL